MDSIDWSMVVDAAVASYVLPQDGSLAYGSASQADLVAYTIEKSWPEIVKVV